MGRATPPIRNGESVSFVALNRNKRSLVLDLKRPEATEILRKLAAKSDVFLEAYRPGALEKLGLGSEHIKAANPRIVYTSVSGFGQSGPYRRRAGVNLIIEAVRKLRGTAVNQVADVEHAMMAAGRSALVLGKL